MTDPSSSGNLRQLAGDLERPRRMMSRLWGNRAFWQIRLRWAVPPALVLAVLGGPLFGIVIPARPILLTAAAILVYNFAFALYMLRRPPQSAVPGRDRKFAMIQTALDWTAMLILLHYTGGPASPLVFFFPFHVVSAAILFRPSTAFQFAGAATLGLAVLSWAKYHGWVACHPILVHGQSFSFLDRPGHLTLWVAFLSLSLFLVAGLATRIVRRLRYGVREVAVVTERVAILNDRLNSLYSMVRAVGRERRLDPILSIVTSEIGAVMDVAIVTVKLLDEDGKRLRYVASHGLPPDFGSEHYVSLEESPLNRRVIEGGTVELVHVGEGDGRIRLLPALQGLGISWTLSAPLVVEGRPIGVLSAFRRDKGGFGDSDGDFLRLAAELVAVAIEDARMNEAIQDLMQERSRFTLQVAHNLRAPLGASIGMLETVSDGRLGELPEKAEEFLDRAERRLRSLNATVGELLTLARTGDLTRPDDDVLVDPATLAEQLERTWRPRADERGIEWRLESEPDLPTLRGDPALFEQLLENVVSNALKYTERGGRVTTRFRREVAAALPGAADTIALEVEDTGIGIPESEREHLFQEFFRASNARRLDVAGTGLGLAIVKRTVERLGGRLELDSEVGRGTRVTAFLPVARTAGT